MKCSLATSGKIKAGGVVRHPLKQPLLLIQCFVSAVAAAAPQAAQCRLGKLWPTASAAANAHPAPVPRASDRSALEAGPTPDAEQVLAGFLVGVLHG